MLQARFLKTVLCEIRDLRGSDHSFEFDLQPIDLFSRLDVMRFFVAQTIMGMSELKFTLRGLA